MTPNTWNKAALKQTRMLEVLNDIIKHSNKLRDEMQTKQKSATYRDLGLLMERLGNQLADAGKDVQAIKDRFENTADRKQNMKPGERPWRIRWQDPYGETHTTTCYGKTDRAAEKQFKDLKLNYVKWAVDKNGDALKEYVKYKIISIIPGELD